MVDYKKLYEDMVQNIYDLIDEAESNGVEDILVKDLDALAKNNQVWLLKAECDDVFGQYFEYIEKKNTYAEALSEADLWFKFDGLFSFMSDFRNQIKEEFFNTHFDDMHFIFNYCQNRVQQILNEKADEEIGLEEGTEELE